MRRDLLDSRELIRRLKEGAPIEIGGDVIRLPRFTEVRETMVSDFGVDATHEVIVAKSRTATWCLWALQRKARFEMKDGQLFVSILDAIKGAIPQKPVKGWVLTTATICDDTRAFLQDAGHQIHRVVNGT